VIALLLAVVAGTAHGSMVVSGEATPLHHAYVVEKNTLFKVIVSAEAIDDPASADDFTGIAVQLDEKKRAEEVFFFHPKLPPGLSVRQLSRFEPKTITATRVAGRLVLDDPGNSFTYDVTFDAPVVHAKETIEKLPEDATKEDHALWRLKQLNIDFTADEFRRRVMDGDADAVKLMLEAGMPAETREALHEAVEMNKPAVIKLLIDAGANVNWRDAAGQSLVMNAVEHPDIVKLLIDAKADVNAANDYKITPLASAAERGNLESVKLLLAAGANVRHRDPTGGSALMVAVLRGYKDIVRTLIDAGADVARDKDDLLALAKDKPEIRAMIEEAARKKR
jgi:hypothetical protein